MRWFYSFAIASAILLGSQSAASAGFNETVVVSSSHVAVCPHCGHVHTRTNPVKGFFQKLWELEKRKNAWLIRTFLR